jgi:hypothetical protein
MAGDDDAAARQQRTRDAIDRAAALKPGWVLKPGQAPPDLRVNVRGFLEKADYIDGDGEVQNAAGVWGTYTGPDATVGDLMLFKRAPAPGLVGMETVQFFVRWAHACGLPDTRDEIAALVDLVRKQLRAESAREDALEAGRTVPSRYARPKSPKWKKGTAGRKLLMMREFRDWLDTAQPMVRDDERLSAHARGVMWVLFSYANPKTMTTSCGLRTLQRVTGHGRATLIRLTDELQDFNIVTKLPGRPGKASADNTSRFVLRGDDDWGKGMGHVVPHALRGATRAPQPVPQGPEHEVPESDL